MKECAHIEIIKNKDGVEVIFHCTNCENKAIRKGKLLSVMIGDIVTVIDGIGCTQKINDDKSIDYHFNSKPF